jgi:hypothetical protein
MAELQKRQSYYYETVEKVDRDFETLLNTASARELTKKTELMPTNVSLYRNGKRNPRIEVKIRILDQYYGLV